MYNVVDTYWASKLSSAALGGMGASFPFFLFLLSLAVGISNGGLALISNTIGAKKEDEAHRFASQAISLGLIATIVTMCVLLPFLSLLLDTFGNLSDVTKQAAFDYLSVLIWGAPPFVFSQVLTAPLLARGLTKIFRNVLVISFFLNVMFDPLFMYGLSFHGVLLIPSMGLKGIALATVAIQFLASLYYLYINIKNKYLSHFNMKNYMLHWSYVKEILTQGMAPFFNMFAIAIGSYIINKFLAMNGSDDAIAAYGTALRLEQIALIPAMGINAALSSIIGQNNGAKQFDRVKLGFYLSLALGGTTLIIFYLPIAFSGHWLMSIFNKHSNSAIVEIGAYYLRVQSLSYLTYIIIFLSTGTLQGIKKPMMSLWVSLLRQVILPVPIYILMSYYFAVNGVFWGIFIINFIAAIIMFTYTVRKLKALV